MALLRAQIKANAAAGILITHSRTAADTADRILVLKNGQLEATAAGRRLASIFIAFCRLFG